MGGFFYHTQNFCNPNIIGNSKSQSFLKRQFNLFTTLTSFLLFTNRKHSTLAMLPSKSSTIFFMKSHTRLAFKISESNAYFKFRISLPETSWKTSNSKKEATASK